MADAMLFPDTFEEFVRIFGFVDSGEHYTNGSELIQVFRVEQWLEHELNRLEKENANYSRNNRSLTAAVIEMQKALKKQSAEIERLQKENNQFADIGKMYSEIKAEAIKEFIKKLKEKKHECGCNYRKKPVYAVTEEKIDETYKEMVGDAE